MNSPWNDELRVKLMCWLMEFGGGWVDYKTRMGNKPWNKVRGKIAIARNLDTYDCKQEPVVFTSDKPWDGCTEGLRIRLNERALAFLKGEEDA